MWELDYKESWAQKNWCFWTVVLEKTLESPLDCKEIQPVHPKGDQTWVFIGRTDVEAETPILWPPDAMSWLIWKDPDAGKEGRRRNDGWRDGWMASLTQWTWIWVNSMSWWWTGRPMRSQRVRHDWAAGLNWTELKATFQAKMGMIKDRHGIDLTEAEYIKKRWQEYTEELYKRNLMTQITMTVWSFT